MHLKQTVQKIAFEVTPNNALWGFVKENVSRQRYYIVEKI